MPDTTIANLPASTGIVGNEAIPSENATDNRRITPIQLGDWGYGGATPTPWVHAIAGDSIGVMYGQRATGSAAFHSLCQVPRAIQFDGGLRYWNSDATVNYARSHNFAIAGAGSGTQFGGGNVGLTAPGNMGAIAALNPHSLEIVIGRNDAAGSLPSTATNILTLIDNLRARPGCRTRSFGIHMPLPGTAGVSDGTALTGQGYFQLRQALENIRQTRRGVFLFDIVDLAYDPATVFGPIGGAAGTAGAVLADGVHPSSFLAIAARDRYTAFLDAMGLPRDNQRVVSQGDFWNTSITGGNLLGENLSVSSSGATLTPNAAGLSNGTFAGSVAFTGTGNSVGVTGNRASVWVPSSTGADLIVGLSKGTYTDPVTGKVNPTQRLTFNNTSPIAADRTFNLVVQQNNAANATRIDPTKRHEAQVMARLVNPVGLVDMGFYLQTLVNSTFYYQPFGIRDTSANIYRADGTKGAFRNYDSFTGNLCMNQSGVRFPGTTNLLYFGISFVFVAGSTPTGTIDLYDAGLWRMES